MLQNWAGLRTAQMSINSGLAAPSHETPPCGGAATPELIDLVRPYLPSVPESPGAWFTRDRVCHICAV